MHCFKILNKWEENYYLADVKNGKSEAGEGLKSHSASVAKLKSELKIFDLVSLHRV